MSAFLEGIGALIGKVTTFIPGRVEQMKNEKTRLLNERSSIFEKQPTAALSMRVGIIDKRVSEINSILGNKATD